MRLSIQGISCSGDAGSPHLPELGELQGDGLLAGTAFLASPNCDERPAGTVVRLLVVHAISLPPETFGGSGVEQLFTNRLDPAAHLYYADIHQLRVSAHFFIRRDGTLIQFVPTHLRAWHAGVSNWRGYARCNDFSLGIELEGSDHQAFTAAQYLRLAALIQRLAQHYPVEDVVGHSDIAPGRKTDPGPFFEWPHLRGLLGCS
ncbi:MAG: 1,6-anhydro-N-acetylmuramyl-L-alanine amidase AmpD [Betaproteobacteria bacterium]|nr:1,6-anhydro-N-acetylmuramyl-L-alanine amidase AmpD [Betaproteobacteria bacterium]